MKKIISTFIFMFISSGLVYADRDWKSYPASGCAPVGTSVDTIDIVSYDNYGGICNLSRKDDLDIVCPIVRDFSRSRMPIETRHSGRTGNDEQELHCRLRNMRTEASDNGLPMGDNSVGLEPISMDLTEPFAVHHVITDTDTGEKNNDFSGTVLTCTLPKAKHILTKVVTSCLYNYSIYEWDGQ